MKRLLLLCLMMSGTALATPSNYSHPNQLTLHLSSSNERCYDIAMKYFNACKNTLVSHLWLDETGKIINERTDARAPYTLNDSDTKWVMNFLRQRDFSKHINPDNPKPVRIMVPMDIFHKKQPINADTIPQLRQYCAENKNRCDVNELESILSQLDSKPF